VTHTERLESELDRVRRRFGITVPNSEIVEIIELAAKAPAGEALLLMKHEIQGACDHYERTMPAFTALPQPPGRFAGSELCGQFMPWGCSIHDWPKFALAF
jgi:hypothetical protein